VPAPAVIPASIVYFKVVAVKTLVVLFRRTHASPGFARSSLLMIKVGSSCGGFGHGHEGGCFCTARGMGP